MKNTPMIMMITSKKITPKIKRNQETKKMGKATKIMRSSISTFLSSTSSSSSTLLALPFALSALLAQSLASSSRQFPPLHARLASLSLAAGFPPSSELFAVLNLKLSQTLLSFLFLLPFTLSSLLLSKASVIRALFRHFTPPPSRQQTTTFLSWLDILNPLLVTQFCNSLVILSANATSFCLLIVLFDAADALGVSSSSPRALLVLSAVGAVVYSIVVANAYIVCNLALIVSGVERRGGFGSVLKACVLIRGRTGTALSLAVPVNMALAGIEALFQYRIIRTYNRTMVVDFAVVLEAMLVAYMYAMIVVLDTIVGSVFLKSCRADYVIDRNRIEEERDESSFFGKEKAFEFLL